MLYREFLINPYYEPPLTYVHALITSLTSIRITRYSIIARIHNELPTLSRYMLYGEVRVLCSLHWAESIVPKFYVSFIPTYELPNIILNYLIYFLFRKEDYILISTYVTLFAIQRKLLESIITLATCTAVSDY